MSQRERQRFHLVQMVIKGALSLVKAAAAMNVSYRHAKRLAARFRQWGAAGLIHGNRGRPAAGGGPRCLDSLMGVISSESVFGFLNFIEKHQAALVKGWGRL